jgi:hypothetical protein
VGEKGQQEYDSDYLYECDMTEERPEEEKCFNYNGEQFGYDTD